VRVFLRWFVVPSSKSAETALISNRQGDLAKNVRVTTDNWSEGKVKSWRKVRATKSVRVKVGAVEDADTRGIRLTIYWDDVRETGNRVTFILPDSGDDAPRPEIPARSTKQRTGESFRVSNPNKVQERMHLSALWEIDVTYSSEVFTRITAEQNR
jgi:hypothetical protein